MLVITRNKVVNLDKALTLRIQGDGGVWAWFGGEDEALLYRGPEAQRVLADLAASMGAGVAIYDMRQEGQNGR